MAMVSSSWRLVLPRGDHELPPLMINACFRPASSSYTVQLTDLTHTWRESLDRRAILRRSLDEQTSIDPSEDAAQFRVFLHKVEQSLCGSPDTTVAVAMAAATPAGNLPSLVLRATIPLPAPLQPLEWPIYLAPVPPEHHTQHFTLPVLRAYAANLSMMRNLQEVIRQKDVVIQKLLDKLIASGANLAEIFPGAAGKTTRKMTVEEAEKRIKGLGKFDAQRFAEDKSQDQPDVMTLIRQVFQPEDGPHAGAHPAPAHIGRANWWDEVQDRPVQLDFPTSLDHHPHQTGGSAVAGIQAPADGSAEHAGAGAVVPSTLPSDPQDRRAELHGTAVTHDAVTSSQDHLDPKVPDTAAGPAPENAAKKIGLIGGKRQLKKATESDHTGVGRPGPSVPDTTVADLAQDRKPIPRRTGLGRIGGRQRPQETAPVAESAGDRQPPCPPPATDADASLERPLQKEAQHLRSRETSQERADRKRSELKKELADPSRAPLKKKRKF